LISILISIRVSVHHSSVMRVVGGRVTGDMSCQLHFFFPHSSVLSAKRAGCSSYMIFYRNNEYVNHFASKMIRRKDWQDLENCLINSSKLG
jgi:hypothetical protein